MYNIQLMVEEQPNPFIQFAKDSLGITAYQWTRRYGGSRLHAFFDLTLENFGPGTARLFRERINFPPTTLLVEGTLPDVASLMVSVGIGAGVGLTTDNSMLALGSMYTARFIFAGIIHSRLNTLLRDE